jgi:hypothetical protein
LGALLGREAAQIGQALFRDQHLHVVLGVVDVRYNSPAESLLRCFAAILFSRLVFFLQVCVQ